MHRFQELVRTDLGVATAIGEISIAIRARVLVVSRVSFCGHKHLGGRCIAQASQWCQAVASILFVEAGYFVRYPPRGRLFAYSVTFRNVFTNFFIVLQVIAAI
ncbi:hypothetical protein TRVL_10148 [Trypanosoma vivax]|nr:hypothetical protein TRVL_10148 [Trypanosoma vivax]